SQDELDALSMGEGAQPLANPLSREMAVLRTSLLPGLIKVAGRNLRRQIASFGLFETGHCFRQTGGENLQETWRLGLLLTGNVHPEHFSDAPRSVDFFDLKGEIEHLLAFNAIAGKVAFERIELPWLHPGQAAALLIDGNQVGWLGQLHQGLNERLELDQPALLVG